MANLGNGIMGFFGGESTGGGGGTSTGVNGLNGTTNIGLGGTLTGNTTIDGDGFTFQILNADSFSFNSINVANNGTSTLNVNSLEINSIVQDLSGTNSVQLIQTKNRYRTKYLTNNLGLNLDFPNREFTLGDYDDAFTKTQLIVDDLNGWVYTNFFTTSQCGIFLTETNATFSAFDGTNKISLNIVGSTKEFNATYAGGTVNGLSLNFDTFVYKFGGFDIASNGTLLQINDATFTTSLNTDILELSGAIIDNNAPQNIGVKYLVVTLSGVEYSILCTETNL